MNNTNDYQYAQGKENGQKLTANEVVLRQRLLMRGMMEFFMAE